MAEPLNRLLNDSRQAAEIYSNLIGDGKVDSLMWELVGIRKDHEQLAGNVKRKMREIGAQPMERDAPSWPSIGRRQALRLYDDPDALQALRDAERTELENCRRMLENGRDERIVDTFVSAEVIPVLNAHVETLERYLERARRQGRA